MLKHMPIISWAISVCILAALVVAGVIDKKPARYDCSTAQWHPDVPKDIKAKCREVKP